MVNLLNNAVAHYGPIPVIGAAFAVGIVALPIIKRITELTIILFKFMAEWANEYALTIRMRSMGCEICAESHRGHIDAAHTP